MAVDGEHDEDAKRANATGAAISGSSSRSAGAPADAGAVLPSAGAECAEPVPGQSPTGPQGHFVAPRGGRKETGGDGQVSCGSRGSAGAARRGVPGAASERLGH